MQPYSASSAGNNNHKTHNEFLKCAEYKVNLKFGCVRFKRVDHCHFA